ncbi:ABC transporter substrate-binding protein [Bifidobacterium sp. SMB2]|uniref:ABC transporter substrate-binding protein n=2 Tax=Bifidobacterium TaxID=1678 RepID=A0ABX0CJG5_9BIFI|nr:ABC transporter substrate-binding protein [Bifidobacterium sp. SMB2]NEH12515.1 ABC transporter substrate-binding protein [Bifidobacterium saimiriisciurei]
MLVTMRREHSRHGRTRQERRQAYDDGGSSRGVERAKSGGMKSIVVFLVALLVLGGAGWAAYSLLVNHRNPLGSIALPGEGPSTSVTIGLTQSPQSLDIRTQSDDAVAQALLGNVYETLLTRDENNRPASGIAESWKTSDDGLVYTFRIAGGLRFSNGDVLDANDVVWSLQQTIQRKYVGADRLKHLVSVKTDGDSTVVITLSKPLPELAWLLSGRAGIVYDADAKYSYDTTAVGSGPFTVKSWDKGASLVLRYNGSHQGTKAKAGTVTLKYFADAKAAVAAMAKGDVDAVPDVPAGELATLRSHDDVTLTQGDSYDKVLLGFNSSDNSLFSDAHMRQGVRYSLNNAEIVKENGAAAELGGPISSLDPGYEDLTGLYPYDTAKATPLLNYFIFRAPSVYREMPNGPQIGDRPMKLVYPKRFGEQLGTTIKNQLEQVNIPVDITMLDDDAWQKQVVEKRDFDMTIYSMDDSHDVGELVDPDLFLNYTSSKAEELYNSAEAATNEQDYEQRLKALARQVSSDSPVDWLYVRRPWTAVRNGVTGMPTNMVDEYLPLADVARG